jgi:hypothetical protein
MAAGSVSATTGIVPLILIVLYAMRGVQLLKGDPNAARRILWLHGIGAVVALMQMTSSSGLVFVLQGVKVAINLFGAATAYWAWRTSQRRPAFP